LERLLGKKKNAYSSVIETAKVMAFVSGRHYHALTDRQAIAGKYIGQADVIAIGVNI
jgi:hypothetical protein